MHFGHAFDHDTCGIGESKIKYAANFSAGDTKEEPHSDHSKINSRAVERVETASR